MFTLMEYQVTYTCISWGAHTFVLVDAILALAILTGTARTVIFIDLTIHPWEKYNHKFISKNSNMHFLIDHHHNTLKVTITSL